jgi:hypothetical protein
VSPDPITGSLLHRQARKDALISVISGRVGYPVPGSPRTGGFDGGARRTVPSRRHPLQEHDELLIELLRSRGAAVGQM